jgi:hypothetical protein
MLTAHGLSLPAMTALAALSAFPTQVTPAGRREMNF